MREQTKYTHLIDRVAGLPKQLTAIVLQEHTAMSPSACYWRLREGKGLISLYDQESLSLWSKILSDIRRFTGSPMSLKFFYRDNIKIYRLQLLKAMEEYRTWLEEGVRPIHHYELFECSCAAVWRYSIIDYALGFYLKDKGFDLITPPDQSIWTMAAAERNEIREPRRAMVKKIIEENIINWEEVYKVAADMSKEVQKKQNDIDSQINMLLRDYDNTADEEEQKSIMKSVDHLSSICPLVVLDEYTTTLYLDEIWQIRTNFDNRSSAECYINGRLLWISDIPSKTVEHREIYNNNIAVLQKFKYWKEEKKVQLAEMKKVKKVHYDDEEIYASIMNFLYQLQIPEVPEIKEKKKAEAQGLKTSLD